MKIYRIELETDRSAGPWSDIIDDYLRFLLPPSVRIMLKPVTLADDVAELTHRRLPSAHPGPQNDGIPASIVETHEYHCAFVSLKQYREWFETKLVREALYSRFKMELHQYEVPKERVVFGRHQVMFKFEDATLIRVLTKEEAIK